MRKEIKTECYRIERRYFSSSLNTREGDFAPNVKGDRRRKKNYLKITVKVFQCQVAVQQHI